MWHACQVGIFKSIVLSPRPREFVINPTARDEVRRRGIMVSIYDRWKRTRCEVSAVSLVEDWLEKHQQRRKDPPGSKKNKVMAEVKAEPKAQAEEDRPPSPPSPPVLATDLGSEGNIPDLGTAQPGADSRPDVI